MQKLTLTIALLLATLLAGCVLSFHPLFSEKETIFDPALVGVWKAKQADTNSEERIDVVFTISHYPQMGKTYVLQTDIKEQPQGRFVAQIGLIGTNRFIQIGPQRPDNIHAKSLYGGHFIQAFSFWKLTLDGDKLKLAEMNYQWLETMLKQKKLNIKYEQREGEFIVLTASTQELQEFITKYADDPAVFGHGIEFDRKK